MSGNTMAENNTQGLPRSEMSSPRPHHVCTIQRPPSRHPTHDLGSAASRTSYRAYRTEAFKEGNLQASGQTKPLVPTKTRYSSSQRRLKMSYGGNTNHFGMSTVNGDLRLAMQSNPPLPLHPCCLHAENPIEWLQRSIHTLSLLSGRQLRPDFREREILST
jgi:hypothetical protein